MTSLQKNEIWYAIIQIANTVKLRETKKSHSITEISSNLQGKVRRISSYLRLRETIEFQACWNLQLCLLHRRNSLRNFRNWSNVTIVQVQFRRRPRRNIYSADSVKSFTALQTHPHFFVPDRTYCNLFGWKFLMHRNQHTTNATS